MPYFGAKLYSETHVVCDLILSDAVRRGNPWLQGVKSGDLKSVGTGRFKRRLMLIDILEWCEQRTPQWEIVSTTTTAPTASNPQGAWTFVYFKERDV